MNENLDNLLKPAEPLADWIEVFIETSREGLEPLAGYLYSIGLTGLVIEDEDEFSEFLENPAREWDYIDEDLSKEQRGFGITFYLRNNQSGQEDFSLIKSGLPALRGFCDFDLGSLLLSVKNINEQDWANNWKKYFKPFPVSERLYIKPSWESLPDSGGRAVLTIDPGNVFGSGIHETTKMCLEGLDEFVKTGDRVLDIGCGSGILAVGALLLGAESAEALDIDKNAEAVVRHNAAINNIPLEKIHPMTGDILGDEEFNAVYSGNKYQVVVANIVADIVIALSAMVPKYLSENGIFISSGIISERLDEVLEALNKNGFKVLKIKEMGTWRAVIAKI